MKRFRDDEATAAATEAIEPKRPNDASVGSSFKVEGLIGAGSYGTVYQVEAPSGSKYAMKLNKKPTEANDIFAMMDIARDIFGLSKAGLLEGLVSADEFNDRIGFLMPLLGPKIGNSFMPYMNTGAAASLLGPIAQDLLKFDGMHRDIKLANICYGSEAGRARLVDFSLATNTKTSDDSAVITVWYRPPEVILEDLYDSKVDVWSFGLVLLNLLSGSHFSRCGDEESKHMYLLDIYDHFGWPSKQPDLDLKLRKIFGKLPFKYDNVGSYNIRQAIWNVDSSLKSMDSAYDLLSKMLKTDPTYRATIAEVAAHPFWSFADAVQPTVALKAKKVSTANDVFQFLSKSTILSYVAEDHINTIKAKVQLMDYLYYYGTLAGISVQTIVKSFGLYTNFSNFTSKSGIVYKMCAIILASAFNEDFRTRQDQTWSYWCQVFDEDPKTEATKLQSALMEFLFKCRGHWPTLEPAKAEDALSASRSLGPTVSGPGGLQAFLAIGPQDIVLECIRDLQKDNAIVTMKIKM